MPSESGGARAMCGRRASGGGLKSSHALLQAAINWDIVLRLFGVPPGRYSCVLVHTLPVSSRLLRTPEDHRQEDPHLDGHREPQSNGILSTREGDGTKEDQGEHPFECTYHCT